MAQQKCVVKECRNTEAADCKGLCLKCYPVAKRVVGSGEVTWEQLEARGLARLKPSKFMEQFQQEQRGGE